MNNYIVAPRRRGYWIERVNLDRSRTPIERYDTEEKAIARLRTLQQGSGEDAENGKVQHLPARRV